MKSMDQYTLTAAESSYLAALLAGKAAAEGAVEGAVNMIMQTQQLKDVTFDIPTFTFKSKPTTFKSKPKPPELPAVAGE